MVISGSRDAVPVRWDWKANRIEALEPPEFTHPPYAVHITPDESSIAWVVNYYSQSTYAGLTVVPYER